MAVEHITAAGYREGIRVPYSWSERRVLGQSVQLEAFCQKLGKIATDQPDGFALSGIVLGAAHHSRRVVLLGLDPSRSFGAPSPEDCQGMTRTVASRGMDWTVEPDALQQAGKVRMLMGLREGYESAARVFSVHDLQHALTDAGVAATATLAGDIFSVRKTPDGLRNHTEPGVAIFADHDVLPGLLSAAHALKQQRVVAEFTDYTQVYESIKD